MKLRCPKCGAEDNDLRDIPRFVVKLEGFEGTYCDACYIRFITANIPKLIPVDGQSTPAPTGKSPIVSVEIPPKTGGPAKESSSWN